MPFTPDELDALQVRLAGIAAAGEKDWLVQVIVAVATATMDHNDRAIERKTFPYRGTWDHAATYKAGELCTHRGSMWWCRTGNLGVTPGTDDAWQLVVKRGRDGRGRASK